MSLASVLGSRLKRNWAGNVSASTWVDEIGVSNAVQATSARQPTAITTLAGNGALSFSPDGSFSTNADVMVAPAAGTSSTPNYTLACGICKVDPAFGNDGNGCVLFQIGTGAAGGIVYIYPPLGNNALRAAGYGNTAFAYGSANINDGLWHTWIAQWNVSARTVELWFDGGTTGADPPPASSNSIDLSSMPCLFGATDTNGVAVYQGGLGCVAVAQDSATFSGDIAAVHAALAEYIRAVQHGTDGASTTGTTSLSVAYPSGISAGDKLLLAVVNKYPTNGPSTPSGWTLEAQASGGAGTAGADSGTVYTTIFSKVATGTESGSLSVTLTGANSAIGRMLRYTVPSGYAWDTAVASGSDNTAGTAFSVACGSAPGFSAGDVAVCFAGTNTDARTYSAETLTASGATFSGMTERQDSVAATGDQCALVVAEFYVSSGSSSSNPTFAMTASGTTANQNAGSAVVLRLRASATAGGAISGTVPVGVTFSGTLSGTGALGGSAPISVSPAGVLRGAGALSGSVAVAVSFAGTIDSAALMSGSVPLTLTFAGALTGAGALVGFAPVAITPAGSLSGRGSLLGSVPVAITPSGALSAIGQLSGAVALSISPSATLRGTGSLVGSAPIAITPSGVLASIGALAGSVPLSVLPAGTLKGTGDLSGAISVALVFAGAVSSAGSGTLSGILPVALTFSGLLTGGGALSGSVPVAITPAGQLKGLGALAGMVPISVSSAGVLAGIGRLTGNAPLAIAFGASLGGFGALAGSVPISVSPGGVLQGQGALVGTLPLGMAAAGALAGVGALVGVLPVSLLPAGTLTDLGGFVAPPIPDGELSVVGLTPLGYVITFDNDATVKVHTS